MATMPVRFKRVSAAFDEEARARLRGSSGIEHVGQSLTDLSDLVNTFLENGDGGLGDKENDADSSERNCSDSEIRDALKKLFSRESSGGCGDGDAGSGAAKMEVYAAVENALREVSDDVSALDFKRCLMSRLRHRGLDAGLCKSKWEKFGNCLSGDHEYVDVYMGGGTRYFVEVSVAKEFTIARPTRCYSSLLNMFPQVFVGKEGELKQLTRLMCNAMKKSMKKMDMYVPQWRRLRYTQAKWFSSYKRTTDEAPPRAAHRPFVDAHNDNDVSSRAEEEEEVRRRKSMSAPAISFLCRKDFSTKDGGGLRAGNLAVLFNDNSILS